MFGVFPNFAVTSHCGGEAPLICFNCIIAAVVWASVLHERIQKGGEGVQTPPLKNHKHIRFLCNTGLDLVYVSVLIDQHILVDMKLSEHDLMSYGILQREFLSA